MVTSTAMETVLCSVNLQFSTNRFFLIGICLSAFQCRHTFTAVAKINPDSSTDQVTVCQLLTAGDVVSEQGPSLDWHHHQFAISYPTKWRGRYSTLPAVVQLWCWWVCGWVTNTTSHDQSDYEWRRYATPEYMCTQTYYHCTSHGRVWYFTLITHKV